MFFALPNEKELAAAKPKPKPSILDDDSDGDDRSTSGERPNEASGRCCGGKRRNAIDLSKEYMYKLKRPSLDADALPEQADPSRMPQVYSYDAVYGEIHPESSATERRCVRERVPRYINGMKANAIARQKMLDAAFDRRIHRETEQEKQQLGETEVFVSAAYKRQLEADKKWLEQSKAADEDLSKKDVGSFALNMKLFGDGYGAEQEHAQPQDGVHHADVTPSATDSQSQSQSPTVAPMTDTKRSSAVEYERRLKQKEREDAERRRREERELYEAARKRERAKQAKFNAEYLRAQEERKRQEEEAKQRLIEKNKTKITAEKLTSAKEKYLARKKAREEAAKEAAGTTSEQH